MCVFKFVALRQVLSLGGQSYASLMYHVLGFRVGGVPSQLQLKKFKASVFVMKLIWPPNEWS